MDPPLKSGKTVDNNAYAKLLSDVVNLDSNDSEMDEENSQEIPRIANREDGIDEDDILPSQEDYVASDREEYEDYPEEETDE